MIDKMGGRKAFGAFFVVSAGALTVYFKGDIPQHFLELLSWVFSAFVAGNAAEHLAGALKKPQEVLEQIAQVEVPTEAIDAAASRIDAVEEALQTVQGSITEIAQFLGEKEKKAKEQAAKNRSVLGV